MSTVSVLVIAGTGRPYLAEALRSLVRQDKTDWEAIVVESCLRAEDTAEVRRQVSEVGDTRVRTIVDDGDRAYPPRAARKWNLALRNATAPFVAFLDDDDMKEDGWLSAMCGPLLADLSLGATVCNGTVINKDGVEQGAAFGNASLDYTHLIRANFVTTGQLVVRRSVIDATGSFDEALLCAEDYDFCLRLSAYPWRKVDSVKCLKRDAVDNACYHPDVGGHTQAALRRIISKHGVLYLCHGCGQGFSSPDESFVWCVDGVGFRNWHYGCTPMGKK